MRAPPSWKACLAALSLTSSTACGTATDHQRSTLLLATTTSVDDTGLLAELVPAFEEAHPGYRVQWIAVGTGEALEIGRRGDADVVFVHSPAAESAFVAAGHGIERRQVMQNDFVIVGPGADPASIRGTTDAAAGLRAIHDGGHPFVSRGDDSGTHKKEIALWTAAGLTAPVPAQARPDGWRGWYMDAGQGMAAVLLIASQREAYTMSDRGTYLVNRDRVRLGLLLEGDPRLANPYGVIQVRSAANPTAARTFVDWLTGPGGQRLIGRFGVDRFGEPLFEPIAGR